MHVILHPGQFLGALAAKKDIVQYDAKLDSVTVSELESSLFTCRCEAVNRVEIFAIKDHLGFATIPASKAESVRDLAYFPLQSKLHIRPTVLHTGMNDLNAVVHPVVTVLNSGHIERGERFLYCKCSCSSYYLYYT
jgi:opine dehydrogenase